MAYNEFKPLFWSKYIQTENAKYTVLEALTNRQFEGELVYGKEVKILGVVRPTISDYDQATGFGDPETVTPTSAFLKIDKQKSIHFMMDDIDKAQTQPGLMEELLSETSVGLAEARDLHIATVAAAQAGTVVASAEIDADSEWDAAIMTGLETIWKAGVKPSERPFIIVPTWGYKYVLSLLQDLKTDNTDLVKNGVIGYYNGARVIMSNNLYNDGTDDHVLIGSNKSIAFARQITDLEPYRNHKFKADAIQGFDTYGCKVIRPKELYCIKAHE